MRRRTTPAALLSLALTSPLTVPAAVAAAPSPVRTAVVATGLDNPRQLGWDHSGSALVVAEAGRGGDTCFGEGEEQVCVGLTGGISRIPDPAKARNVRPQRIATGLTSIAGPSGSFAVGADGVAATQVPGGYAVVQTTAPPPGALPPGFVPPPGSLEQLGRLLFTGRGHIHLSTDLGAAEVAKNPDGAQIESNPYAVLVVPSAGRSPGYALVADAAANAVWRISFAPGVADPVSVFAAYPTEAGDEETPEFVPTSLARDHAGNVYVGGLGSEQPGAAEVVKYSPDGRELRRWGGFTGITGVAVDRAGALYVSQLFGSAPGPDGPPQGPGDDVPGPGPGAPGDVVRVTDAGRTTVPVPFPAGLAVDRAGRVYVSAFSVSDADGTPAGAQGPGMPGGQIWRLSF
ncbi:hypothetical protein NUM3379_26600 [Kineococcus sp. NUM-3379]